MIEDMEDDLSDASEINYKTDTSAVTEESETDEAIPIYLKNNERHKHKRKQ